MKEYLVTVNRFRKPDVLVGQQAEGQLILELLLLNPGTNPLHPDMGVGLQRWRYCTQKEIPSLIERIQKQMDTYLPNTHDPSVTLHYNDDKTCDIEINVNGVIYMYDSSENPIPITLQDLAN